MGNKRDMLPVGSCTKCGTTSFNMNRINEICHRRDDGKRCQGVFGSALNDGDWEECSSCDSTRRVDNKQCFQCDGTGWIFIRERF